MDYDEEFACELETSSDGPIPNWAKYIIGLSRELGTLGHLGSGFDLAFRGTVPPGAGLSSSAALTTAMALALERAFSYVLDPMESVKLCQRVEHRWVGVECGIMDQMVSRFGRDGQAILLDCRSLEWSEVPIDLQGHRWLIIDSGVRRQLNDSSYNQRRAECDIAVSHLRARDPSVSSLRDVDPERHADAISELDPTIASRVHHVLAETVRVLKTAQLLAAGELLSVGKLILASHRSLKELYEVSHPRLDQLVDRAIEIDGVLGARMTGAGFGGCVIALCQADSMSSLEFAMREVLAEHGHSGWVRELGPVTPAGVVEDST
jgi:galactokinase